jgi:hypothetical protein
LWWVDGPRRHRLTWLHGRSADVCTVGGLGRARTHHAAADGHSGHAAADGHAADADDSGDTGADDARTDADDRAHADWAADAGDGRV